MPLLAAVLAKGLHFLGIMGIKEQVDCEHLFMTNVKSVALF